MNDLYRNDLIIQGITEKGRLFRPSDWSERLSGILSHFDQDNRLSYNRYVRPLMINQVRCVVVAKELEQQNPGMFRFLMDFASDNHLRICEGSLADTIALPDKSPAPQQASPYTIREILSENTAEAYPAILTLRSHLTSQEEFVQQVNDILRPTGYRLYGIYEKGRAQALAVCGFRVSHSLAWGHYLDLKDLSTLPEFRESDLPRQLLDFVHEEAKRLGHLPIHVDAQVTVDRQQTHRLYFEAGYRISSFHFMRDY